ncbi:MAG: hypothetical protein ACRELY_14210 [Polyangiaceae bacterium]
MEREAIERFVDAWCACDADRGFLPTDREVVEATRSIRALVVEETDRGGRDLLNACARLGRMIAERGGSPSLMAATADGLARALGTASTFDEHAVRVALAEGFAAARLEIARAESLAAWDPPHCIVRVDADTIAVAAGFPDDDHDALEAWSAKIAQAALSCGARTAFVAGRAAAVRAATDALTLVGVTIAAGPGKRGSEKTSWLPWRKNKAK